MKTKKELIYLRLREAILSGELNPGARVIVEKIAKDFGVSNTPIREAIKLLEVEELVQVSLNGEVVVSKLMEKDVRELCAIRGILEGFATHIAAQEATTELYEILDNVISEMEIAERHNDGEYYRKLNKKFHKVIFNSISNKQLSNLIEAITARTQTARPLYAYHKIRMQDSLVKHKKILETMKKRDYKLVEKIVADQVCHCMNVFIDYSKESLP